MTPRAGYELYISPYLSHAYRDRGSEGAVLISPPSSIPGRFRIRLDTPLALRVLSPSEHGIRPADTASSGQVRAVT